ncbi:hypothetical protein [Clostridium perfringens]|uniref:hypothetical protein n=1 Tax=Clostridium perfringens TaxID=1502 RepID=UPI001C85E018|nr:hypothetical protein [Clostridium perfringens]
MLKKLFLDLNNFKSNLGSVERGDSIELNIKLLNDEDYSRSKFRLLGAKSDGKSVEQIEGLNLEEKDLKVVLEDQFVNCEGIVKLELNVVSGETEITTKEFYFFVSNTMNASIIDSADSLPTLEKVSKYVDDAVDNLEALKGASEDITLINGEFKEAEIKRKANELLRERSEKERVRLESIRTTEEADRIKAEAERKAAENNRKVAETNRKLAENTRKTNEAARVEAELNRQSLFEENEEIRNENENLRIEAEKERKLTFSNNNKFESERVEAEKLRAIAEDKRVTAEKARAKAEEERVKAETRRENTYTDFNDSELERKNNEANRVRAEAERVNAENGRNEAYEESERVREEAFKVSEAARNEAEEGRVAAEVLRVEAEKLRAAGEENRNNTFTQSEEERKDIFEEAENTRKVAESKRDENESSRVEAEKLRVTEETGRVEAENLRVAAEEERVAAETKREEEFNKFEGRISANTKELKAARSATTGEQFDSLDERIDCEVDRLNKKIEVSMLEQDLKENHSILNTVEGLTTDIVIKGKTLRNLEPGHNIKLNLGTWNTFLKGSKEMYKPNSKYTVVVIVEDNKLIEGTCTLFANDENTSTIFKTGEEIVLTKESKGIYTQVYTTKSNLENCTKVGFWTHNPASTNGNLTISMMILEGEESLIPSIYFDGLKSFGGNESKISAFSSGKNLIKPPTANVTISSTSNTPEVVITKNGEYILNGSSTITGGRHSFKNLTPTIMLKKGKKYKLNGEDLNNIYLWVNKVSDSSALFSNKSGVYTADEDVEVFLGINYTVTDYNNLIIKPQLEEGTKTTDYKQYKEDKKDILLQTFGLDGGLKSLNSTFDEINSIKLKVIKRIEMLVLNGKGNWVINTQRENFIRFQLEISKKPANSGTTKIISDTIPSNGDVFDKPTIFSYTTHGIIVGIEKSKLNTHDLDGFKTWLKANPVTVYYELAEPVEISLEEKINLKTFGERTYVSFKNSISGTSSFKAPVNAAATISRLNRENRALEEENKNLRQDFESTTLTLTDSDLELVKQNVDMDFRLMEVEFALDIPQAILSSNIKLKNKKGEVKSMARTPYEMMKIVILSGDYDREDYMHKVGKYYERGRMTKEEHDELMSLMTADEVISK